MLTRGDDLEAVRIATGLSRAVLDAIIKDIERQHVAHECDGEPEF